MYNVTVTFGDGATHEFTIDVLSDFNGADPDTIIDDILAEHGANVASVEITDEDGEFVTDYLRMTSRTYTRKS